MIEASEATLRLSISDIHSQTPIIALESAYRFNSTGFSPKPMNLACQAEFLRKVQNRNNNNMEE